MINEIPERDPVPHKSASNTLSLTRLAILLTLVFIVLLAMLLGSRALDILAAKLWPAPSPSSVEVAMPKTETRIDISKTGLPTPNSSTNSISTSNNQVQQSSHIQPLPSLPVKDQPQGAVSDESPSNTLVGTPSLLNTHADNEKMAKIDSEKKPETISSHTIQTVESGVVVTESALINKVEPKPESEQKTLQTTNQKQAKGLESKQYTTFEKEILKNDPRHYTVQILGVHNKNKLKHFMSESKLQGKVRYCRGNHQGKPWYVLIYGEFATREEAEKMLATLPEEVKKQKPWIRSFASLQGTIHARE